MWLLHPGSSLSQLNHCPRQEGDREDEEKDCGSAGLHAVAAKTTVPKPGRWKVGGSILPCVHARGHFGFEFTSFKAISK